MLRLIRTFLAHLLALSGIGDKLHLSRLHEGAFEIFLEGLGIERLMGAIQYRAHHDGGFTPHNLGKALGPGTIERILDQGFCGQARVGIVPTSAKVNGCLQGPLRHGCRACGQCQYEDAEHEPALPALEMCLHACVSSPLRYGWTWATLYSKVRMPSGHAPLKWAMKRCTSRAISSSGLYVERRHTVADVPVLYCIDPGGIAFLEIGFMLGFLQSNDVISSLQITRLDLQRKALSPDAGNPQGAQGVDGEWAHGANVVDAFVERQAARKRLPRQGMMSAAMALKSSSAKRLR